MQYDFIDKNLDKKEIFKNNASGINKFLLENNSKQVEQIIDFFEDISSLLLIQGFQGTGKTSIVEHATQFLTQECIVLQYTCFETSLIDDMLLSFFDSFKKLTALGKIETPKIKTENFVQKINSYFQTVKTPILVVIDSIEEILETNKSVFNDFINHLAHFDNIKIIIIGKHFKKFDFQEKYKKINILALEKGVFEKYLRSEDFTQIGPLTDELYKNTKGYYFYTELSLKIMKIKQLSLIDFIDNFSKSFLSFNDFILREALSLIDPISGHLIRFLTIIRHPVSIKLLKTLQLWNEEKILFFVNNLILTEAGEYIYIKNYYKLIAENSIHPHIAIKIHQNCIKLYETQLPLKPFERDLLISRQTMRNEIEFHSNFIPQKIILPETISQKTENTTETTPTISEIKEETNENINQNIVSNIIFTFDNEEIIDEIAKSINNYITQKENELLAENEDNKLSLAELINYANQEEKNFNYKHVISLCTKAMLKTKDDDYYTFLPIIYSKLATSFKNISDWLNALKYFEMLEDFYLATGDIENTNNARYNIAHIYFVTFKLQKTKELLNKINKENISNDLRIKVLNLLANLSDDNETAYNYYKQALDISNASTNKTTLAELYYKFASACENKEDYKNALMYYKKCTEFANSYTSEAYYNMAMLYDELGEQKTAIKYYNESLNIDTNNNNLNGMYNTYMKLAEINFGTNPDNASKYYNHALEVSKQLNDEFYTASTATALGDLLYSQNASQMALKYYEMALNSLKGSDKEQANTNKIINKINQIKLHLGEINADNKN